MIPPEEKAKELMLKYYDLIPMNTISFAKECALIAVDEVIEGFGYISVWLSTLEYWQEVKQEIEKL
jgi:hypothetical protein